MNTRRRPLRKQDATVLILCAAVLAAVLGASGEGGRRRAKEIVCQANLRQWHTIFQGYIEQNGGKFLSGEQGTPGYWWPRWLSNEHKDWKRLRIWLCPRADTPAQDEYGRMAPTLSIFSAWGVYQTEGFGPNGICGSYGLNGYVIPIAGTFESGVRATDGWRDLHDVPEANNVPMFIDALRFDVWPLPTDGPANNEFAVWSGNHMARCCINRHDGAVNCLFVDGSVRRVGLKELWTLKWHKSFNTVGPWTKAGGVTPFDWPAWIRPFQDY